MRLSGKSKLLKKTPVGAASSRELKRSRLEAAPTKSIHLFFPDDRAINYYGLSLENGVRGESCGLVDLPVKRQAQGVMFRGMKA